MNSDRVVLITGSASGIGTALVDRFLCNNDTAIGTDLHKDVLERWRGRWPQDAKLVPGAADVRSEEDGERVARLVRERFGRLDVLANRAGCFPILGFEAMPTAQSRHIINVDGGSVKH